MSKQPVDRYKYYSSPLNAKTMDLQLRFRPWFTDPPHCVRWLHGYPMRVYSYKPHYRNKAVGWL